MALELDQAASPSLTHDIARWISQEYHDMNGSSIQTLESPPTAAEFAQLVHISRPVVIKGFQIPALKRWTDDYLQTKLQDQLISVAITPNGRVQADAITAGPGGRHFFVEPFIEKVLMEKLLEQLNAGTCTPERNSDNLSASYLQSQNGNMYSSRFFESPNDDSSEFGALRGDVPSNIPWVTEALGRNPDAVNLWIGNSKSITSIHSDPYENIYTVIRGSKHFTLLPPCEGWCLQERMYPHAVYGHTDNSNCLSVIPSSDTPQVRWSSVINPDLPGSLPSEAHPLHVTLEAGDTLYLPVGWWHYVQQSGPTTIALNWWYDAEVRGMNWIWLSLLRGSGDVPSGNDETDTR
ncbi:cupin-like domain-containing protein [Suillus plorans]|uniref:Cupin-like domain-containing protein n=1 Tax=Suillus plorans TaxID=116603 RepID=A0A9P7DZ93_9AGAM|nr:cupin-like domain-containing protein [Suillus plorans]KAG1806803.1 cupin-like domain-containing protein [Suillus plorans]